MPISDISADGSLVSFASGMIVDPATGNFYVPPLGGYPVFSPQQTFIAVMVQLPDYRYQCLLYGHEDNTWPYRSGIVRPRGEVTLYDQPNGAAQGTTTERMVVFARSADEAWYRVDEEAWVAAADVKPVFWSEGIPVEGVVVP